MIRTCRALIRAVTRKADLRLRRRSAALSPDWYGVGITLATLVSVSSDIALPVLEDLPLQGVAPGTFTWWAALTDAASTNLVGYLDSFQIEITP